MSEELTLKACPHCGAGGSHKTSYSCGTFRDSEVRRTARCRERELNAVRGDLEQLRDWKDSVLVVEDEWDIQHLAKLCGATLGQSCRVAISEAVQSIPKLRARVTELESAAVLQMLQSDKACGQLRAANAGLLEALRPVLGLYDEFLEGDRDYAGAYYSSCKGQHEKWEKARAAIAGAENDLAQAAPTINSTNSQDAKS